MRIASEESMACEVGRLPGLPSSGVMLETVRGRDETLGFSDVLNLPHEAPEAARASLHDQTERLYGISGGEKFI